jgi:hypothetical protein
MRLLLSHEEGEEKEESTRELVETEHPKKTFLSPRTHKFRPSGPDKFAPCRRCIPDKLRSCTADPVEQSVVPLIV